LRICQRVAHRNLADVTHEESRFRPQPGGNSINWLIGHITAVRDRILTSFGEPGVLPERSAILYTRNLDALGEETLPLQQLIDAYDAAQEPLITALMTLDEDRLAGKAPFSPIDDPTETMRSFLTAVSFHE